MPPGTRSPAGSATRSRSGSARPRSTAGPTRPCGSSLPVRSACLGAPSGSSRAPSPGRRWSRYGARRPPRVAPAWTPAPALTSWIAAPGRVSGGSAVTSAPESSDLDPLRRFSDRVEDYVRYRPGYPAGLIRALRSKAGLAQTSVVADVGSGTGIFTRLLLDEGARVFAVEPNDTMRGAAEAELRSRANFVSVKGTAEATGLEDHSVSLVTCAQAFHWFDPAGTRREFRRILAAGGWCALIWNTAIAGGSDF